MGALFAAITVGLILLGFGGWLATDALRQHQRRAAAMSIAARYSPERADMGRHDGHHNTAVTVADLLARTAAEGRALRLNWSATDTDPNGMATVDHDWPTAVLPTIEDDMPNPLAATQGAAATADLPRREPGAISPPTRPVQPTTDPELLDRVLRGLRRLE